MKTMIEIIRELTPLNRAVCSRGYDAAVNYLCELLPFRVISVPETRKHNGWVIPPSWDVEKAKIVKNGTVIYDGTAHPLGVIALSAAFSGTVGLEELKRHLHFDHRNDDWIPYHYRQQFRTWSRDWGFCVPKRFFDGLTPGDYEIVIETAEAPGDLKILEYRHQGALENTIVLGGNLDHAGVANDGLAGCVIGLEVMHRLQGRKTRFTYSLVLSPGIIGSELYLAELTQSERAKIQEGIFLEMLGSDTQLAIQEPRRSSTNVFLALRSSLDKLGVSYRTGPFESIIINDEYIWENYGIPMTSFSRFPYPEYHSSMDSADIIREESLQEAVNGLIEAIQWLEAAPLVVKKFEGNVCLSNPQYDLYVDYGQIALGDRSTEDRKRMRQLMDLIPSIENLTSVKAIAEQVGLPEGTTAEYLQKWADKGLIDLL